MPMFRNIVKCLLILAFINFSGCTSVSKKSNFSKPLLLKFNNYSSIYESQKNVQNRVYGSNPIFISGNSKFSIAINEIQVGWLHYEGSSMDGSYGKLLNNLTLEQLNNLKGKELWMLTTICSQNTKDPLEASSKSYVKSTNIKWDSMSHSIVPFDKDELILFTHDADSSYRVSIRIFEVNDIDMKRKLAEVRNNEGIAGLFSSLFSTVKGVFASLIGPQLVNYFSKEISDVMENDSEFQRFLLKMGATEEFRGDFVIYRKPDTFAELYRDEIFKENKYVLYDYFKDKPEIKFATLSNYTSAQNMLRNMKFKYENFNNKPYIQLTVNESQTATDLLEEQSKNGSFKNMIKKEDEKLRQYISSQYDKINENNLAAFLESSNIKFEHKVELNQLRDDHKELESNINAIDKEITVLKNKLKVDKAKLDKFLGVGETDSKEKQLKAQQNELNSVYLILSKFDKLSKLEATNPSTESPEYTEMESLRKELQNENKQKRQERQNRLQAAVNLLSKEKTILENDVSETDLLLTKKKDNLVVNKKNKSINESAFLKIIVDNYLAEASQANVISDTDFKKSYEKIRLLEEKSNKLSNHLALPND